MAAYPSSISAYASFVRSTRSCLTALRASMPSRLLSMGLSTTSSQMATLSCENCTRLSSPKAPPTVAGGGKMLWVARAIGYMCVLAPAPAASATRRTISMAFGSNIAGSTLPVSGSRRSRPPLGAYHMHVPPLAKRAPSCFIERWLCCILAGLSSGSESICFFEYTVRRLQPREKGTTMASRSTRSPAMNTMSCASAPNSGPSWSWKRVKMQCVSLSDWWLERKTTLSPSASCCLILLRLSMPTILQLGQSTSGRVKSTPNWW
mmetsp:Transcript_32623/g.77927  ORF Transcript_32623/g.77927 Transcript_32623/m.77927 type:complete len:263 (-) Transcript_32623:645-1433(-)